MKSEEYNKNSEVEILVVEDSPTQAINLQYHLEKEEFRVTVAKNGLEALAFLKEHRPTLIISDIVMPEMDGFELCRKIKTNEKLKDIPVILLTALAEPDDIIKGLASGAENFVTKPYDIKFLLSRINYVIVNREMRKKSTAEMGIEVYFAGQRHFITSDRLQILDLLISTYEATVQKSRELECAYKELKKAQDELKALNEQLENKVLERTKRISYLNSMILAVRNVNQLITKEKDRDSLLQGSCDSLIKNRSNCNVWIVLLDEAGGFVTAAEAGWGKDFRPMLERLKRNELPDCCRKALKQPGVLVIDDPASECTDCPLAGIYSDIGGLCIRLENRGKIYGLLTGSVPKEFIKDEEEQHLFAEVAGDIAFALSSLELEEERERAVEVLQRERDLIDHIMETSPSGITMVDCNGQIIFANPRAEEVLGLSRKDIISRTYNDSKWRITDWKGNSFPEDNLPFRLVMNTGLPVYDIRHAIEWPDGRRVLLSINATPMFDKSGALSGMVATVEDITSRVLMEEQLKESEEKYRELYDNAPVGYHELDHEGKIVRVNKTEAEMLGYSIEEMLGRNPWEFIAPEEREKSRDALQAKIAGKIKPEPIERKFICKNGKILDFLIDNLLVLDKAGRVIGIRTTLHDITERKKAEEARMLLETAIEQAAEYILITDTEGTIQYVNPAFEKITGYKREEAVGQNPRILKSGVQDVDFYKELWDTIKGGQVWKGHLINKKKDGSLYTEEATISPVHDPSGNIINFVAIKRDITIEISLENQLHHAQKMESIGLLAGGVAHDFNNILTTIMGYSSLLKKSPDMPEKLRKKIEEILKASMRGAEITSQLLTFSRKQPPRLEKIILNDVINNSLRFLKRSLPPDIAIESRLSENLGLVNADSTQMQQILMNLCLNSRDAMPHGGKILVETENIEIEQNYIRNHYYAKHGPHVLLTFSDTGAGMKKEVLSRIFEPFFTTKPVGKGTGLGLPIVYGIVKNHNGIINVYSEVGKGTTFKIYLPQTSGREKVRMVKEPVIKGGKETVLIVEDEEMILRLVSSILEDYGYKCLTAANGLEGLHIYQERGKEIDLVILDVVMPKMNGPELFAEIMKINPGARVVMSSGFSLENEKDLTEQGVRAFIPKPYQERVLARTVREVLDKKKQGKASDYGKDKGKNKDAGSR